MSNRFIDDFLVLDHDKMNQIILQHEEQNKKYFDSKPVLKALSDYRDKIIDFSELSYVVNDSIERCEVRKHFDLNKNINIIDEISLLSECDIGIEEGHVAFDACVTEISDIGKIEACVRSGAYFEHDLTVKHFEEFGNHPSYSDKGLNLSLKVILEEKKAYLFVEIMNGLGRTAKELPLSNNEIRSLHNLILKESHKDNRLAYRLGNFYLHETAQSPEYEIIDDSTEYKHGLALIEYKDSSREEECHRKIIDLDNPEEYLPIGFPCRQLEPHCTYKTFEALQSNYSKDRSEMDVEEELMFVEDCFDTYEYIGFLDTFDSPYEEKAMYNGMKFTVDGRVSHVNDNVDLQVLPMWHITFENGEKAMVFPEEVCKSEHEVKREILSFVNWNDDKFSVMTEISDNLFGIENKYPLMDGQNTIHVNMYDLNTEYCDRLYIYKNNELITSCDYGEIGVGSVNAKWEWIMHFVNEYINGNTDIEFQNVSDEIKTIKSYYDEIKSQTVASKSGKFDSDISIYIDLPRNLVLPLDLVSNEIIGYTDDYNYVMLDRENKSLITDYKDYYTKAITDILNNPHEVISYINAHDSESVIRYMNHFHDLNSGVIRCKFLTNDNKKEYKGMQASY